jgi:uncharacterized protein
MKQYDKPLPDADLDTQPFWDFCRKHELRAQQCPSCGRFRWPPQAICPHCHAWNDEWILLKPTGILYSFSVVHHVTVPAFRPDVPFVNARATVNDTGARVIIPGILVDCPFDSVRVGMALEIFLEDVTETFSLPRFRPLASELAK